MFMHLLDLILQNKPLLKTRLDYFDLLIKLEGLDRTVLDNFCRFVVSASKMMNLQVIKKYADLHFNVCM